MKTKPRFSSKTIQGLLVAILGLVLSWFSVEYTDIELAELATSLIEIAGIAYAWYGREVTKGEKLT